MLKVYDKSRLKLAGKKRRSSVLAGLAIAVPVIATAAASVFYFRQCYAGWQEGMNLYGFLGASQCYRFMQDHVTRRGNRNFMPPCPPQEFVLDNGARIIVAIRDNMNRDAITFERWTDYDPAGFRLEVRGFAVEQDRKINLSAFTGIDLTLENTKLKAEIDRLPRWRMVGQAIMYGVIQLPQPTARTLAPGG
jgi:hypothetical protein